MGKVLLGMVEAVQQDILSCLNIGQCVEVLEVSYDVDFFSNALDFKIVAIHWIKFRENLPLRYDVINHCSCELLT